ARPQSDRDDRRETALPAARPRQFFRLRPVSVAPGGVVVVTMVVVIMPIMRVIVTVIMVMVSMIVMLMIVLVMILGCHRGADRMQRPAQASRLADKALALDPDQPRAHQRDQRIARKFNHALGVAH